VEGETMIGVGMTINQFKTVFAKQALMTKIERAQTNGLRAVGAMTRIVAKRSMRRGRFMKVAEFPPELKALISGMRDNATGKLVTRKTLNISPMPKLASRPNQAPLYYGKQLRDFVLYFVDPARMSVVTGPAKLERMKQKGTPELLEHGGKRTESVGSWKKLYNNGQPIIRLANPRTRSITYEGRGFMKSAHNIAVDSLVPQIWENSLR
jgi:hypothetical protein